MNIFQTLSSRMRKAVDSDCLPDVNSHVDVTIDGVTEQLSVEAVTPTHLTFRSHTRAKPGERMIFSYVNGHGRYRFASVCSSVDPPVAECAFPAEVTAVESFKNKRRDFRYKKLLTVTWRYAPDGKGYGDFTQSTITDLSRGGCLLVVSRALKAGSQLEIRLILGNAPPLSLIGTLTRQTQPIATGKCVAGLSFEPLPKPAVKAIEDYINERVSADRGPRHPTAR